jgi:hypothetical protein
MKVGDTVKVKKIVSVLNDDMALEETWVGVEGKVIDTNSFLIWPYEVEVIKGNDTIKKGTTFLFKREELEII